MANWAEKTKSRWHRLSRITQIVIVVLVLLLIAFRLALPSFVERYVNQKLDELPTYDGQIGQVDIHLWRGAYTIHRVDIHKTSGKVSEPFFSARRVDFSVQWPELFHGSVVGEIEVEQGKLNFVKGPTKEESQTEVDKNWTKVVEDLFPFKINQFQFRESEVWFRDVSSKPKVDVFVTNMFLIATNFTNSREVSTNLPASLRVAGRSLGNGELKLEMRLDPFAARPTFDLNAELRNADLVSLNEVLQAYAKIDVKKGRISIFSELAAQDGFFEGYVTPQLQDLDIVDLKQDKNPVKLVWESFVSAMVHLFKNHPKDRLATKIPISGSFEDPKASIWAAFLNVFQNFLHAFPAHVEGTVDAKDLKKMQEKQPVKKK